jgi:hypothetical protein
MSYVDKHLMPGEQIEYRANVHQKKISSIVNCVAILSNFLQANDRGKL